MQKGKKTPPGGLSISERERLQATYVATHTPFSPIHLGPSRKVILFTPFLKESLVYDFGRHIHFSKVAEIEEMDREDGIFLRSTTV